MAESGSSEEENSYLSASDDDNNLKTPPMKDFYKNAIVIQNCLECEHEKVFLQFEICKGCYQDSNKQAIPHPLDVKDLELNQQSLGIGDRITYIHPGPHQDKERHYVEIIGTHLGSIEEENNSYHSLLTLQNFLDDSVMTEDMYVKKVTYQYNHINGKTNPNPYDRMSVFFYKLSSYQIMVYNPKYVKQYILRYRNAEKKKLEHRVDWMISQCGKPNSLSACLVSSPFAKKKKK